MPKSDRRAKGLKGVNGLVSSVINQAKHDALRGDPAMKADALRYLRSDWYRTHLQMIDKPEDWLPQDKD